MLLYSAPVQLGTIRVDYALQAPSVGHFNHFLISIPCIYHDCLLIELIDLALRLLLIDPGCIFHSNNSNWGHSKSMLHTSGSVCNLHLFPIPLFRPNHVALHAQTTALLHQQIAFPQGFTGF